MILLLHEDLGNLFRHREFSKRFTLPDAIAVIANGFVFIFEIIPEHVFRVFRCAYRLGSYHWHFAKIVDLPREDQGMIELLLGVDFELGGDVHVLGAAGAAVVLGGCMQSTIEPASEANLTVRDKKLLAAAPYEKATIPEPYRRHLVEYHRKEMPGTIVIDSDARYLYYVLPEGKAIRYGVTVGEEAMAWSGVAKVERMPEWPSWTPTPGAVSHTHL